MATQKVWSIDGSDVRTPKSAFAPQKRNRGRSVASVLGLVLLAGTVGSGATSLAILKGPKLAEAIETWISPPVVKPVPMKNENWQQTWQAPIAAGGPITFSTALKQIAPANTDFEVSSDVVRLVADRTVAWRAGTRLSALNDVVQQINAEARALPGVLLVTPAPFSYRIEKGVSISEQLGAWARHAGWELDWNAVEASKLTGSSKLNVEPSNPIDWPAAGSANLGTDFDRAFAATIAGMNLLRKQQGGAPVIASADFTTGRIEVRFADRQAASPHTPAPRKSAAETPNLNVSEMRIDTSK